MKSPADPDEQRPLDVLAEPLPGGATPDGWATRGGAAVT